MYDSDGGFLSLSLLLFSFVWWAELMECSEIIGNSVLMSLIWKVDDRRKIWTKNRRETNEAKKEKNA